MKWLLFLLMVLFCLDGYAQKKSFRFAFISDTHIGSPNGSAEEDLRRTVADINSIPDLAFVVITGDITELGKNTELQLAKQILDSLKIPYYIIPGNHDTGWSESGGLGYTSTFGYDSFHFVHEGIHFIGTPSGPYVRMSDGHVPRHAMNWLKKELKSIPRKAPVVFLNHYPLDAGLDNWYEVIELLKKKHTILALCGHGHANRKVFAEGIPAVMGRSNLRARAVEGGYNIVHVQQDSIRFTERKPLSREEKKWIATVNAKQNYSASIAHARPDFSVNQQYAFIQPQWTWSSSSNVISTPALTANQLVVFGNQEGIIEALDKATGKKRWEYKTGGPIFSSPATAGNFIVLGSADGRIYCLDTLGNRLWTIKTGAAVLGSALIHHGNVYIGGSDGIMRGIELASGKPILEIPGLRGPVTSKPVIQDNILVFGAWDTFLYAYDLHKKNLLWKWNNGSAVINYSPAACIPVIHNNTVYIVAPDRAISAIDLMTGKTLWRSKRAAVRESIGISQDGKLVYGKTMQDTVVAFPALRDSVAPAFMMHAGYGYEHAPSMLIEREGKLFFGTRNGRVYAIDPQKQEVLWIHKIDNSMVNTIHVIRGNELIVSTMDGKVCLLKDLRSAPAPVNQP